jgi:hypothetical protein
VEFDGEATKAALLEKLNEYKEEKGEDADEEVIEYYEECMNKCDEHELDYTHYAYREQPDGFDHEDVIILKEYKFWLKAVFDGFDEICRRLKMNIFKISPKWDCVKTFEELVSDAKFIFIQQGHGNYLPQIVLNTPIEGFDCIEIDYDKEGLTNGGVSKFDDNWGITIDDSSKDCVSFLKNFLELDGAVDLLNN